MRQNRISFSDAIKSFGIKRILISMFSLIVIIGLINLCFSFMYSSEKENILLKGELSAEHSMEQFNRYMTVATNTVKASKFKIEKIIDEGGDNEEILESLKEDTKALDALGIGKFSGLYACIDGKFFDGYGWEPKEGFDPTKRPWYVKAIENEGELTVIEPYEDAETGEMMVSIVLTLKNKKDVVAIDVSYEVIHYMQENANDDNDENNVACDFIIDKDGGVLVHSNESEIGKNYRKEKGTLGSEVVRELFSINDNYFDLTYDGVTYVVYAVQINDDWFSVSVVDADNSYSPLRRIQNTTVIITILAIVLLMLLYFNIITKHLASERLNTQLAATADIYFAVIDIDVINDIAIPIRSSLKMSKADRKQFKSAKNGMGIIVDRIAAEDYKEMLREFVELDTLQDRMISNTITIEFFSFSNIWCRARFIVSKRTQDGKISRVLWMVESIDEEKRKRDELHDISEKAKAASDAKSAFLSNMSHEIRTPINAVLGMNEMVLRESNDETIITYAENIQTAGTTLLSLVNEILDISKIEAGRMEIIPVEYDISSGINDIVHMIQPRADEKGLVLELDIDSNIPCRLYGDEVRIRQILTNILTNAVKYTEKGKVTFTLGFDKIENEPDSIIIKAYIRDTGIGIKKENIPLIFSEYERFDEERNRHIEGTGLGMPITQKLLNMMGSTLEIESEYGKGSVFGFRLKQKVVNHQPLGDYQLSYKKNLAKRKKYKAQFTAPDARVLVVDDTKMNLFVFKSLLKQTKVQIDTATSGDEGIAAAVKNEYDIIFLDHMMPRKDGIETLKELKETDNNSSKDAVIICLTANAISGMRDQYISAGFDDYLTKPIDSVKLEEMMMRYLPDEKVHRQED